MERSNTRRASARDYLERSVTIGPDSYVNAVGDDMDDSKTPNPPIRIRTQSPPRPSRRDSDLSIRRTETDPVSATSGNSGSSNRRVSRLDWIRRGKLARGEPGGDDDYEEADSVIHQMTASASDRV